jgi:hypothetical protein
LIRFIAGLLLSVVCVPSVICNVSRLLRSIRWAL